MPLYVCKLKSHTILMYLTSTTIGPALFMGSLKKSFLITHQNLTHYVDANLMRDIMTGRSVTGILHMINKTPLDWYPKKKATVETATYGSEFVASRICVEQIIDLRNTLRYLGVPIRATWCSHSS